MKGCLVVFIVAIAIVLAFMFPPLAIAVFIVASILIFFILIYKLILNLLLLVLNLYWTLFETLVNLLQKALTSVPQFNQKEFMEVKSILTAILMGVFNTVILYLLLDIHFVLTLLISVIISVFFWIAKTQKRSISEELYEQKKTNLMLSGRSFREAEEILNEHYEIE